MSPFPQAYGSFIDHDAPHLYTEPIKDHNRRPDEDDFEIHDTGDGLGELRIQAREQDTQTEEVLKETISTLI